MMIESLLQGGDTRTHIYAPLFFATFTWPAALQALLITSKKLSPSAKQCLSIPLLLADLLIPLNFTSGNMGE